VNLAVIQKILEAKVIWGEDLEKREVLTGFGCDLMSDCLVFAKPKSLMLTGLCNTQVIRTAEILDAQGIVFVRGKQPDQEMIDLAKDKGIPLLSTNKLMFDSCGLLFTAGLRGG
jgi:predicted transcriptional regulator